MLGESVLQIRPNRSVVTSYVKQDFHGFLANAAGYQDPQFQKLIYLGSDVDG